MASGKMGFNILFLVEIWAWKWGNKVVKGRRASTVRYAAERRNELGGHTQPWT